MTGGTTADAMTDATTTHATAGGATRRPDATKTGPAATMTAIVDRARTVVRLASDLPGLVRPRHTAITVF